MSSLPKDKASKKAVASDNSRIVYKKDVMVAVRMPKGLIEELRDIQKVNHFMDMSDEIRFIVRKYCIQSPISNITASESESSLIENRRKEKMIEDLNKILDQLRAGQANHE